MFSNGMQGTQRKYKILWFVVDMHHRQRYFFICDCKQIVTKPGVNCRREVAEKKKAAVISISPFCVLCHRFNLPISRRIAPIKAGDSKNFLLNERIP
jgi:hypothetical protein